MWRLLSRLEALPSAHFILIVGLLGGALRGIPALFYIDATGAGSRRVQLGLGVAVAIVSWTAAAIACYLAVRRRRYSIWWAAGQLALARAVVDILETALIFMRDSSAMRGQIPVSLTDVLPDIVASNLVLTGVRAVVWFLEALVVIAPARRILPRDTDGTTARAAMEPEAVT